MKQVLPSMVVTTTEEWKAKHRILSAGSFTVGAGGAVTLEAGTRVVLGDGFSVSSGAVSGGDRQSADGLLVGTAEAATDITPTAA